MVGLNVNMVLDVLKRNKIKVVGKFIIPNKVTGIKLWGMIDFLTSNHGYIIRPQTKEEN